MPGGRLMRGRRGSPWRRLSPGRSAAEEPCRSPAMRKPLLSCWRFNCSQVDKIEAALPARLSRASVSPGSHGVSGPRLSFFPEKSLQKRKYLRFLPHSAAVKALTAKTELYNPSTILHNPSTTLHNPSTIPHNPSTVNMRLLHHKFAPLPVNQSQRPLSCFKIVRRRSFAIVPDAARDTSPPCAAALLGNRFSGRIQTPPGLPRYRRRSV